MTYAQGAQVNEYTALYDSFRRRTAHGQAVVDGRVLVYPFGNFESSVSIPPMLLNSMRQAVLHDVLRTAGAPFPPVSYTHLMSDWNIFLLRSVVLEYPEKVVYSGFDEMLVPGLLYGADGCIGTWANLLPDLYAKVYARVRAGGTDAVKPVMDEFTAFLAVGWNYGIIDTFEELMRCLLYTSRCV